MQDTSFSDRKQSRGRDHPRFNPLTPRSDQDVNSPHNFKHFALNK